MLNRSASLAMSTRELKALLGKLDIKRTSPMLYLLVAVAAVCSKAMFLLLLALNAPIATKVVCFFSSAEMFKKPIWQTVWIWVHAVCF